MAANWAKVRIDLPEELGPEDREIVAEEVLSFIRKRTAKQLDKENNRFPRYTKEYTESLDFKNAGKSKGNVNLKLSGDMLAAMDLLSHRKGSILVGFENGTPENARADGNIRGTYGQSESTGKVRDFLGITPEDVNKILKRQSVRQRLELDVTGPPLQIEVSSGDS